MTLLGTYLYIVITFRIFRVREFQNILGIPLDEISSFLILFSLLFHFEPLKLDQTYPQKPEFLVLTRFGSEILENHENPLEIMKIRDFPKPSPTSRGRNFTNFRSWTMSKYTGHVCSSRSFHFWYYFLVFSL